MKVLITGANGFIGSAMVRFLRTTLPAADIAGLLRQPPAPGAALPFRPVSAPEPADLLIDLAGKGGIPESHNDPAAAFDTDCRRIIRLVDAARELGIGRVVLASTCAVYPFSPDPAQEDGPLDPDSPYALARRTAELYALAATRLAGQDLRIARLANIYGPGQRRLMIHDMAQRVRRGEPVELHSGGRELRDFVHVDDTARAIWTIATRGTAGEIYNVGSGAPRRVFDVASRIHQAFGAHLDAPSPGAQDSAVMRDAYPDVSKLRALGFDTEVGFDQGLAETLDWITRTA